MADLSATFALACARRLTGTSPDHPCARLHGHTFGVVVTVQGPVHPVTGWVVDFADIARAWQQVHNALDHRLLNDIAGLDNPTSEQLAIWIWRALQPQLPQLSAVEVSETGGFRVTYRGA